MKTNRLKEYFWSRSLRPLLVFTILTIIFTFPLVTRFTQELPKGGGDTYQSVANIALRVDGLKSQPVYEKIKFLLGHPDTYTPYVTLNFFFSSITAYNLMFLLSFILSGWGAYLLAYYFTKNPWASFLAGIIFAFSPFHFYQATAVHLGTMHQEWLPFFALALFKFLEKIEFKYFLLTVFFGLLIAISEHQLVAFTAPFVVFFLLFQVLTRKELLRNKKLWIYIIISILIFSFVAFFFFGYLIEIATSQNNYLDAGISSAKRYAMDILDPLITPSFHSIWPVIHNLAKDNLSGITSPGSYFVGFSVFVFLLLVLVKSFRQYKLQIRKYLENKPAFFWSGVSLIYIICALGPGISLWKHNIYLPYYLIYKFVPFYENIRTTGRFFVWAMLGLAILVALFWNKLSPKIHKKKFTYLSLFFSLIILLEFWVAPLQTMNLDYSPFYDRLAKEYGNFKLLEIPGSTDYEFVSYQSFTNTIHHKKTVGGMPIVRKIAGQFDFERNTPVIKQLLYTIPKGTDPDKKNPPEYFKNANFILRESQIGYITISKKYLKEKNVILAEKFIEKYIRYEERYEDEYLIAYKVPLLEPKPFSVGIVTDIHAGPQKDLSKSPANTFFPRKYIQNLQPVLEQNFDLYISLGDQTDSTAGKYALALKELFKNKNILWTKGNHDTKSNWKILTGSDRLYYFVEKNNWRFIFLDSSQANSNGEGFIFPEQVAWLKNALKTDKRVFVAVHHPLFRNKDRQELIEIYAETKKILEDSGNVKYVFSGHQHTRNFCREENRITYCSLPALSLKDGEGFYKSLILE